jgi:DNA-binding PadR family transcriptional regulator
MFDSGQLRLVLLLLLEGQPRHGYDLIRAIEERTGGAYAPSPGVVYPTLTLLEEQELVTATVSDSAKRVYAITAAGTAELNASRADAENALARLDALGAETGRLDTGPVSRAMQNLRAVLEQRLRGTTDRQVLFDVAELIDEAARRIERL